MQTNKKPPTDPTSKTLTLSYKLILHHTRHKICYFRYILPSQFIGARQQKLNPMQKLNKTKQAETYKLNIHKISNLKQRHNKKYKPNQHITLGTAYICECTTVVNKTAKSSYDYLPS